MPEASRLLIEALPTAILVVEATGTIVLVNRSAEVLFGYAHDELIGRFVDCLIPERFREAHGAHLMAFFSDPTARPMGLGRELFALRKDGVEVPIEIGLGPIRTPAGLLTLASVVDLTARRRSERLFRVAVEAAPSAMMVVDRDGRIVLVNRQTEALFRYSRQQLLGQPVEMLVPERHRSGHPAHLRAFFQAPGARAVGVGRALFGRRADGSEVPIEIALNPIETAEGAAALASIVDITERLRSTEAQARLAGIVEASNDAIVSVTEGGMISSWNRGAERLFGYSTAEALGRRHAEMVKVAPGAHDAESSVRITQRIERRSTNGSQEVIRLHRDGRALVLSVTSSLLRDSAGSPVVAAIYRDVTDQRSMETQLAVTDRMASLGTLAAGVGHEINNPLSAVLANLELIEDTLRTRAPELFASTDLLGELSDAREGADRIQQIVRDLRSFARPDEETIGPIDVHPVVESTLRLALSEIRHRAMLVKDLSARPLPRVNANASRLGQALLNLLVNAAQSIPEGDRDNHEIRVTTGLDERGRVAIGVSDTGAGISAEVRQRLFTPFFSTKPIGQGTGLGLALSQRLVTSFGGEISLQAKVGRGSHFVIALPVLEAPASTASESPSIAPPAIRAAERGTKALARVLVIDDESSVLRAVERTLGNRHHVQTVETAQAALDLLQTGERFDAILCDVMMPQMTGIAFLRVASLIAGFDPNNVIFMSGAILANETLEVLGALPNRVIQKPFDVRGLRALMDGFVVGRAD